MLNSSRARTRLRAAAHAAITLLALCCVAVPAGAADEPAKPAADATVTIKAQPPSIQIDTQSPPSAAGEEDDAAKPSKGRRSATIRIDGEHDWDPFTIMDTAPWIVGLVFLVVGSIFLTPVILLIGIIWYKLRKTRLQNEAMLALAEKGVVPPAQAADALATSASAATVAPQVYQQAVALRKRVVWSDLRKGVILSMIGLGFSFYAVTASGEPSWVGLILLFVGVGYVALWWLEGRHLDQAAATRSGNGAGGTNSSGG
jgi:Domain of unknown function (DUF6249)